MPAEKFLIRNRHGLKLVIEVNTPDDPKQIVFIAHGQNGFKEQAHIQAFADAFLENNYIVLRFDATNSLGESEGDTMDVTYTSYLEDLEDVIDWAKTQDWYKEPFVLCGHSMGAQSTVWYAEQNPEKVLALAAMAPTINHQLYYPTIDPEERKLWQEQGYIEKESRSKPGVIARVGWGVVEDLKKYDILKQANKLRMPILDIVGEKDWPCPPKHQRQFAKAVGGNNFKLVVLPELDHNYRKGGVASEESMRNVKSILSEWLNDLP